MHSPSALLLLAFLLFIPPVAAQYSVTNERNPSPHPIDVRFEKEFTWETSAQAEQAIAMAEKASRKEIDQNYRTLTSLLDGPQRNMLETAQKAWEAAFVADRKLLFNARPNLLRDTVGREGEICTEREFMVRVRKRALDLAEYIKIFAPPPH